MRESLRTHGQSGTITYRSWIAMTQRCLDSNAQNYQTYGARGINICERWRSFESFLADMGERPSKEHSLDRIDSDGDYEPGNCRWATWDVQARNHRGEASFRAKLTTADVLHIRRLHAAGHTGASLAREYGVGQSCIRAIVARKTWKHV